MEQSNQSAAVSSASSSAPRSSEALHRRLVLLYVQGSAAAVIIVFLLMYLGLELTGSQWVFLLVCIPPGVVVYTLPDIYLIRRHFKPVGEVLGILDRGETPPRELAARAAVRALNLPFYSFLRVTFFHGPTAAAVLVVAMTLNNIWGKGGFQLWQILTFLFIVLFFASPAHAIFEFFGVSRAVAPALERITAAAGGIPREMQSELQSTSIRNKLLYLAVCVSSLPLVFFAVSILFKVDRMFRQVGISPTRAQKLDLLFWVVGVIAVCITGAIAMSILTASEVSRSAARLIDAMNSVEKGNLDVRLTVTATDEYGDLFRGFNLMTEGLHEEAKILDLTQELMGELLLDVLLERIIRATTELLDADRSTLFMYDAKTNELWSRFAQGLQTSEIPMPKGDEPVPVVRMREIRIPAGEGIAGAVFTSGKGVNIADPYSDPRFNQEVDHRTGYKTRSILAMPISNRSGERIGVTQVLNKRGGSFTARDESRLRGFTAQIAIALENARLFDDVLRMKNYNESILRSTTNGMITLDTDQKVATANESSLEILKWSQDDVIGHSAHELFAASNRWILDGLEQVRKTGRSNIVVDTDLVQSDAGTASVNLSTVPLIDLDGDNIGSMLILEDITSEKRVKSTMSRYMSKEVADQLVEQGEAMLAGKDQRISILFSDIRNFTTVSESIGARETVSMLNEYFAVMVDVIFLHGGILDKYIGDAMMALFGAPFTGPQDADNALQTANDMITALRSLNLRRHTEGRDPIDIGIGISTGDAIIGSIGSPKRMEYTVIGDSVNLASRLEGVTKMYGAKVLFSEATMRELKNPGLTREIDLLRVKGKNLPVAVFEALDHFTPESFPRLEETLACYNQGMESYKARDWSGAIDGFAQALTFNPGDKPSWIYLDRARHHSKVPPPEAWDRVWVMTEK